MIVQEDIAHVGTAPTEEPGPWQSRSCEELRAIAGRGVHGGEAYFAAIQELERRAHNTEVAIEHQLVETASLRRYRLWWSAVLIAAIAVVAVARFLIF